MRVLFYMVKVSNVNKMIHIRYLMYIEMSICVNGFLVHIIHLVQ